MRICGYIDHPGLKITIFQMDNRFSVKFESGLYEQTYKFRKGGAVQSESAIRELVDAEFIDRVLQLFQSMHTTTLQALQKNDAQTTEEEFDRII